MTNKIQYVGQITHVEFKPINAALPNRDFTDYIFVQFDGLSGRSVYCEWLRRGSPIIVQRPFRGKKQCIVTQMIYDESGKNVKQIKVAEGDGGRMMHPIEYVIGLEEINSMLIWRAGYQIEAI